jgi:hypothetical protein
MKHFAFVTLVAGVLMAGCAGKENTWYEERCLRLGFERGSDEFYNCIARDLDWVEENRIRRSGQIGP